MGHKDMDTFHIILNAQDRRKISSAPRCSGPEAQEFKKAEIHKMLRMNNIETEQSECASSIIFLGKKVVLLQRFIHYKKVSAVIFKDAYPTRPLD